MYRDSKIIQKLSTFSCSNITKSIKISNSQKTFFSKTKINFIAIKHISNTIFNIMKINLFTNNLLNTKNSQKLLTSRKYFVKKNKNTSFKNRYSFIQK